MKRMRILNFFITFTVFFVLFGCTSLLSNQTRLEEMNAQVANYQLPKLPENEKAIVYVVRPSIDCKPYSFSVFIDNLKPETEMGSTKGGQYIYFDLISGEHKIISKVENWNTVAEMNVSAKGGDIIFLEQQPDMGFITLNNKLLTLQDYQGKYYVKTLARGIFSNQNQQNALAVEKQIQIEQAANADTFIGTIMGGNLTRARSFGFSKLNVKLKVTSESGEQAIFYVRFDSKVFNSSGNPINYLEANHGKDKKVQIQYFIIQDGSGGEPGRSDFDYEIGQKGVLSMRFLDN
jgi:hypothetical protein